MRRTTVQSPRPRSARNPKHRPAHDVVGALQAEHQYASRLLDVLAERLAASSRGEALDHEALHAGMTYMTEHVDGYHHLREDALFALLVKRAPDLAKSIAKVKREHRSIGAAGKRLVAALERTGGDDDAAVRAGVGDYVDAMRAHMGLEERELFARAREVLDEEDLAEIDRTFMHVVDPLFEASLQSAYAAYSPLVRYLAEQPVLQQVAGALDTFLDSALTLGEALFGTTGDASRAPVRAQGPRKAAR
jgi:hemerythrin-like domain-containing protein